MNCKPNDLAIVVAGDPYFVGMIIKVTSLCPDHVNHWDTTPPVNDKRDGFIVCFSDETLRPIRDNPGNEAWVTELRNKLKPTEINERGEVRV